MNKKYFLKLYQTNTLFFNWIKEINTFRKDIFTVPWQKGGLKFPVQLWGQCPLSLLQVILSLQCPHLAVHAWL